MSIKVLVADDSQIVRKAIRMLLEDVSGITLVGEAENLEELFLKSRELRPDVVVLDLHLAKHGVELKNVLGGAGLGCNHVRSGRSGKGTGSAHRGFDAARQRQSSSGVNSDDIRIRTARSIAKRARPDLSRVQDIIEGSAVQRYRFMKSDFRSYFGVKARWIILFLTLPVICYYASKHIVIQQKAYAQIHAVPFVAQIDSYSFKLFFPN